MAGKLSKGCDAVAMSNGCTKYELAVAKIAFWDGPIRCETCPCMEVYQRKQCRMTGEYLVIRGCMGIPVH